MFCIDKRQKHASVNFYLIDSLLNKDTPIIQTLWHVPLVSVLMGFHCIEQTETLGQTKSLTENMSFTTLRISDSTQKLIQRQQGCKPRGVLGCLWLTLNRKKSKPCGNWITDFKRVVRQSPTPLKINSTTMIILGWKNVHLPSYTKKLLKAIIIWLAPWAVKMKRISCSDWLPERSRWSHLDRSGSPAVFLQAKKTVTDATWKSLSS